MHWVRDFDLAISGLALAWYFVRDWFTLEEHHFYRRSTGFDDDVAVVDWRKSLQNSFYFFDIVIDRLYLLLPFLRTGGLLGLHFVHFCILQLN